MLYKNLKLLVITNIGASSLKLPIKFSEWQILIQQSIKNIADKVELKTLITNDTNNAVYRDIYSELEDEEDIDYFVKEPDLIADEDSAINIEENLAMAVVYDIAQMFQSDFALKQKHITDRDMVISDYLWNEFTREELLK